MKVRGDVYIQVEAPDQLLGMNTTEQCFGKLPMGESDKVPHSVSPCGFQLLRELRRSKHTESGIGAQETRLDARCGSEFGVVKVRIQVRWKQAGVHRTCAWQTPRCCELVEETTTPRCSSWASLELRTLGCRWGHRQAHMRRWRKWVGQA